MKRAVQFYETSSPLTQTFLAAIPAAFVFYLSALLGSWISQLWQGPDWWLRVGLHGFLFVFIATVFLFIAGRFKSARAEIRAQKQVERDAIASAHTHCDRVISALVGRIVPHSSPAAFLDIYGGSLTTIREYVKAAYLTFEDSYGGSADPMQRVNFEFTFMTISYHDGKITIPACENRDGRQPRSMVLRQNNADIYKDTETAKIYRAPRPEPIIVGDTKAFPNYAELYPGELTRLRSSVIYPILSDRNELLGTLVAHCDRSGFFDGERSKYWYELLEVFAKHIAVEKRKLDVLTKESGALTLHLPVQPPF
jgi:GAF domain